MIPLTGRRPSTLLIGCGSQKRSTAAAAQDLYTGSLFTARRRYAEYVGSSWYIISAKYGFVKPEQLLQPYDQRLSSLPLLDRIGWALSVARDLISEFNELTDLRHALVEIHAGADYVEHLRDILIACGVSVHLPLRGLSQGEQLKWYARVV